MLNLTAENFQIDIEIPDKVDIEIGKNLITVKGPKGEVKKEFKSKKIKIEKTENKIKLTAKMFTKREKKMMRPTAQGLCMACLLEQGHHKSGIFPLGYYKLKTREGEVFFIFFLSIITCSSRRTKSGTSSSVCQ